MKLKKFILIVSALFLVTQANAQKWRFGLKASPSLSWFKVDTKGVESDGSKLTFSWGFMAEYYFAENYAIASGVDLGGYGGAFNTTNALAIEKYDVRLGFIDIPVTVKMRTNEIGYMRYFGQFGFTPGVNIRGKADYDLNTPFGNISEDDVDVKSDIFPINVGLLIALGAEYSLSGNTSLLVSASFHNGFIDLIEFDVMDPTIANMDNTKDITVNANSIRLNVGVLF